MQPRRPRRIHASTIATLLLAAAFVAAALTAMSVAPPAPFAVAPTSASLSHQSPRAAEAQRSPSPFGHLEFEWSDGVPGFDPLSDSPTPAGP
jgi:hypothetical protein